MRTLPGPAGYGKGDVFVLFGELFGRGYANGLVDEARKAGMTIIGITMGRRETDGSLRPLTAEELTESEKVLGGKIINIPLEAGFDMQCAASGLSPVDQLKGIKSDGWESAALDWVAIEQSRVSGLGRFTGNTCQSDGYNKFIDSGRGQCPFFPTPWQGESPGLGFSCRY